jgi:hypothetical protein
VRRILLVLTVALIMAVMALTMAVPVFAQAADPCTTGETPASPPKEIATPPPDTPPGFTVMAYPDDRAEHSLARAPFTGPNILEDNRCVNSL